MTRPYALSTVDGLPDYQLFIPADGPGWLNSNDNAGGRLFYRRSKVVAAWREAAAWKARQARIPRLPRAYVIAELCFNDRRRRDPANFYPTVKAAIDGLVDAGVLPDDSGDYLVGPDMRLGPRVDAGRGLLVLNVFALPDLPDPFTERKETTHDREHHAGTST